MQTGQDRRYGADPAENEALSYSAEVELEGNEVNPWPYLCSIMQCKLCLPRETKLAAYKIWTSTLHKHVEVRSEASCPFKVRGHVPQIFEPSGF